jgi:membrane-associated phospholipid phosphatase
VNKTINLRFLATILFLAVLAISLSFYASRLPIFPGDINLTLWLQSAGNDALTSSMKSLSWLFGDWRAGILVALAGLLVWWKLGWRIALLIPLAGLVSLLNYSFKMLIGRPRPSPEDVQVMIQESNFSFPSSHAFFTSIFLGMLVYLLFTRLKKKRWKYLSLTVLVLLVFLVGISRVYLGVHWTSDVLGGYIYGGLFLTLLIWVFKSTRREASYQVPSSSKQEKENR